MEKKFKINTNGCTTLAGKVSVRKKGKGPRVMKKNTNKVKMKISALNKKEEEIKECHEDEIPPLKRKISAEILKRVTMINLLLVFFNLLFINWIIC